MLTRSVESGIILMRRGAVAQLGERFLRTEEVVSSNLISSTTSREGGENLRVLPAFSTVCSTPRRSPPLHASGPQSVMQAEAPFGSTRDEFEAKERGRWEVGA
jgi:hypothetical protein